MYILHCMVFDFMTVCFDRDLTFLKVLQFLGLNQNASNCWAMSTLSYFLVCVWGTEKKVRKKEWAHEILRPPLFFLSLLRGMQKKVCKKKWARKSFCDKTK